MTNAIAILAEVRSSPPMLIILYWILLAIWAIFGLIPFGEPFRANVVRGTTVVALILFAIIGYYLFGNPAN